MKLKPVRLKSAGNRKIIPITKEEYELLLHWVRPADAKGKGKKTV